MRKFKLLAVILFLSLLTFKVQSQPGNPDPPDDPVPLTGVEILLLAGGALGGYKLIKRKSSSQQD